MLVPDPLPDSGLGEREVQFLTFEGINRGQILYIELPGRTEPGARLPEVAY